MSTKDPPPHPLSLWTIEAVIFCPFSSFFYFSFFSSLLTKIFLFGLGSFPKIRRFFFLDVFPWRGGKGWGGRVAPRRPAACGWSRWST